MEFPRGPRSGRTFLRVEHLEDRITPAYNPRISLAENVAEGTIAPDRLIVIANASVSAASLGATPYARQVMALGWDMYSVRLNAGTDLGTAISYYGSVPGVSTAEPDQIQHALAMPNDPFYGMQYAPALIGADKVWNTYTGDSNFVIAVIDTGFDFAHQDLQANLYTNPNEIAGNNVDDDGNGFVDDIHGWNFINNTNNPQDDAGHGTHVSGIIGATGNNGVGVAGVNWHIKILPIKFLSEAGGTTSDAIASIHYSVIMGAKVSNNSWGGGGPDPALARAIGMAEQAGQIFVCAAGNNGTNNDDANLSFYPADYSLAFNNVVTVAATDSNDQLASFSQYGARSVMLAAPGVGIYSTYVGNTYMFLDGTSMASPQVAGAIALYWSAHPSLTYTQVIDKLKSSVDKLPGFDTLVSTGGRLDVAKMFDITPAAPLVVGAAPGTDVVRVLAPGGTTQMALTPYAGFLGGVEAAASAETHDIVTAATLGGHVKLFDSSGNLLQSFLAFPGYQGPISVALGDLNGTGDDIIVAANLNGHVKVFDAATGQLLFSQLLYPGYFGRVEVSVADVNGTNELFTAANGAAGVHIQQFAAGSLSRQASYLLLGPNQWSDFSFTTADLNQNGIPELLISQGPRAVIIDPRSRAIQADFLTYDPLTKARVKLEASQFLGNPALQLVAIAQTPGQSQVEVFNYGPDYTLSDSFMAGSR